MITTVIVDDYVANRRWNTYYTGDTVKLVEANWQREDKLLVDLSATKFFDGCTRWCELKPIHFKILIMRTFHHLDQLTQEQFDDDDHPTVKSMYFLIGCMIKCLEERADTEVEMFKIKRLGPETVNFEYIGSIHVELADAPSPGGLRVVVDNT